MDLQMPGMDGIRATTLILAARPGARNLDQSPVFGQGGLDVTNSRNLMVSLRTYRRHFGCGVTGSARPQAPVPDRNSDRPAASWLPGFVPCITSSTCSPSGGGQPERSDDVIEIRRRSLRSDAAPGPVQYRRR
jgi:hypothetical protein